MGQDARKLAEWIRRGIEVGGDYATFHPNILVVALIGVFGSVDEVKLIEDECWPGLGSVFDKYNRYLQLPRLLMMSVAFRSALMENTDSGYTHEHVAQLLERGEFDSASASAA
jgi:hypothetical protein